ncbi:MAG: class I SAM-dependent methyltransferase [Pseudonocardia sp.]|nr:class I SAM-dependent methyltransferase [Pseudonocardia sp.]
MNSNSFTTRRGERWQEVWRDRSDDRADWNGYEALFADEGSYQQFVEDLVSLISSRLNISDEDVVLDLGCGTGRVAQALARRASLVKALDYSETVIRIAQERYAAPNVEYGQLDLNDVSSIPVSATKACAIGSFLYLDSAEVAYSVIDRLNGAGIDVAVLDIADATKTDSRRRAYDRSEYTHLAIDPAEMLERFPTAEIGRDEIPNYVNGSIRFNFYLAAKATRTTRN